MKRSDKLAHLLTSMLADFGASWKFIFLFFFIVFVWVVWNVLPSTKQYHFDEYPFIFLNLAMSVMAAVQAPVVMMASHHQAKKDKKQIEEISQNLKKILDENDK
ncbi:MAG: DUF1003 domain-containing protein [Bacteroidetes bacterium]|nr:DUF1003 domain-containing protein [Bacteroidota bacterium]